MYFFINGFINENNFSFFENITILFISFFSNTFSAISGGGAGLIQLPSLIIYGIPYQQALATHKFATVALGIGSSLRNFKLFKNDLSIFWNVLMFGLPGVVLGASLVEFISEVYLQMLLGVFSIFLAFYSFNKSDFGLLSENKQISLFLNLRFALLIFLIAILNGSISSGTGLLVTILLIKTFGMDFLRAIRLTFFSVGIFWNAIGALCLFKIESVPLNLLILLTLGSFFGGVLGAHLSNLKGNKLIKKTFTLVCLTIGISLLIKSLISFI